MNLEQRAARTAEIKRRFAAGETRADIARALKCSPTLVTYHTNNKYRAKQITQRKVNYHGITRPDEVTKAYARKVRNRLTELYFNKTGRSLKADLLEGL